MAVVGSTKACRSRLVRSTNPIPLIDQQRQTTGLPEQRGRRHRHREEEPGDGQPLEIAPISGAHYLLRKRNAGNRQSASVITERSIFELPVWRS